MTTKILQELNLNPSPFQPSSWGITTQAIPATAIFPT